MMIMDSYIILIILNIHLLLKFMKNYHDLNDFIILFVIEIYEKLL
jgi:hypothetical protein